MIIIIEIDVNLLQKHPHYVAGCRNSTISSRTDLYELLVNIPAREITVAPHAKGNSRIHSCTNRSN